MIVMLTRASATCALLLGDGVGDLTMAGPDTLPVLLTLMLAIMPSCDLVPSLILHPSYNMISNVFSSPTLIADVTIAEGAEFPNLLKVGFLNEKVEERFQTYFCADAFNVVVTHDGPVPPICHEAVHCDAQL